MIFNLEKSSIKYSYLLPLSFIPVIYKGLEYAFIGVFYPLLALVILSLPFLYFFFRKNISKAIKYWSFLIIGYAVIRIFLGIVFMIASNGIPSGVFYQFTPFYHIKSVAFLVLGVLCLVKRKKISESWRS